MMNTWITIPLCVLRMREALILGSFFATQPDSTLCKSFLKPYVEGHFSKESYLVNTKMNEPVICALLPNLRWNGETQVFDGVYIIGCEEYAAMMKHHGTRSWADNLPECTISKMNWLKRLMRKPEIFERLERSKIGRRILPIYTFLAYDLQDLGPMFFIQVNYIKLKNRLCRK